MINLSKLILRDGVDIYFNEDEKFVIFVFLASRKRLKLQINPKLLLIVSKLDGENLLIHYIKKYNLASKEITQLNSLLIYLYNKNILIEKNWIDLLSFDDEYKIFLTRHLRYLLDILDGGIKTVEKIQKNISSTKITIFGLGAVGSALTRELAMMGFQNFILIDYQDIKTQDISRNILYSNSNIGKSKIDVAEKMLLDINPHIKIQKKKKQLNIDTDLSFLSSTDFIINSANKPYIGYTSIKLSRYCVENNKPLFVCGGFDAHLASLGELILPKITPCSDCYSTYFSEALKDWKPINHPIENRDKVFGGLVSLNLFSASTSALTILKYYINNNLSDLNKRGEFLFDNYQIDEFTIPKDENCQICSN